MSLVSVVVPVYHNARSLPDVLARLQSVAKSIPEDVEFLFVDDGSQDDSFSVMQELTRQDSRVRAIKLVRNFGPDAASYAGFEHARGNVVIAISADLQDPPELIADMLERWRSGYRIVLAARKDRQDGLFTRITSNVFWWLFRRFAISNMPAKGCDYVLVDRVVLESRAKIQEPGGGIAMLLWTGYEPAVIYYSRGKRLDRYGRSMWTFPRRITYLIDLFVTFSDFPLRAASVFGFLLAIIGGLYALLLVVTRLLGDDHHAPPGWAISMVVFLVVSGVQMIMIGILGEYFIRGLHVIRKRPTYLIERIVENPADGSKTSDDAESTAADQKNDAESYVRPR